MRFVHDNFTYTPLPPASVTHMTEVVQQRRGVCQDFAHVMLGMCRAIKFPRATSAAIFLTVSNRFLVGSQASHAWCEVYVPGNGWRALDPTNSRQADENFVKVAVGRDYADIVPVKGHYKGPPSEKCRSTLTSPSWNGDGFIMRSFEHLAQKALGLASVPN